MSVIFKDGYTMPFLEILEKVLKTLQKVSKND